MSEQSPPTWWEDPKWPAPATLREVLADQLAFLRISLRGWWAQRGGRAGAPVLRGPLHPTTPSAPGKAPTVRQAPQPPAQAPQPPAQAPQPPAQAPQAASAQTHDGPPPPTAPTSPPADPPSRAWLPPQLAEAPRARPRKPPQADRGHERWLPPEVADGRAKRDA